VYQAPPQAVYQSMRYSTVFGYNIVGLTPGVTYTVRLHFVEPTLFGAGERVFNVTLNGAAFLSNFDIYVAAGYVGNKAVAEVGTATADANGQISIGFSNIANDPLVCAIEILSSGQSSRLVAAAAGSQQTTTAAFPVATLALDRFFALEEAGNSERLNHTVSRGAFSGKEPAVNDHSWKPDVLPGSGDGSADDSKRAATPVEDEGPDDTDWTVFKKDLL
jgi:Malectin domain